MRRDQISSLEFCEVDARGKLYPSRKIDARAAFFYSAVFVSRQPIPHFSKKKCDAITRRGSKWVTLSPEYGDEASANFWARVNDTRTRYARSNTTIQMEPLPFESGSNMLPGLEQWFKQHATINRRKGIVEERS